MPDDPLYSAKILGAVGSQDITDADIVGAVDEVAFSDSSGASPEMLYGRDGWDQRRAADPEGSVALAQFDYDWNFAMTPRKRAEAVWFNGFRDGGFDLLRSTDERTYAATRAMDAAHLAAVRRRRGGIGGV